MMGQDNMFGAISKRLCGLRFYACHLLAGLVLTGWGSSGMGADAPPKLSFGLKQAKELPLAESNRVYLAEIEHRSLTLSRKAFPAIAAALQKSDAVQFAKYLSPAFRGGTLNLAAARGFETDVVKIHRLRTTDEPKPKPESADAGTFVNYLLGLRGHYGQETKVEIALMSLSPVEPRNLDGLWRGSCALRLFGGMENGGKKELLAKIEFDLLRVPDVDVILTDPGWIQSLRFYDLQESTSTHDLMAEVGKARGIDRALFQDNWKAPPNNRPIVTGGVFLADIDNDGRQDILIVDVNGAFLFHALPGGRYEEITEKAGLPRKMRGLSSAAFGDFDNDGFTDLILVGQQGVHVFKNLGGTRFDDVTFLTKLWFDKATGLTVGDFDKDGFLDIYVSRGDNNSASSSKVNSWIDGPGGPGNQLWRNRGGWNFEDVSKTANATAGHLSCFTAAWLDANNDGWPDIYCINEFGGGVLLVNQGNGTFKEQHLINDIGDFGSMGMCVGDFNNDGNIDIYTCNMYSKAGRRIMENLPANSYPPAVFSKMKRFVTGSELYRNSGGLNFERAGKKLDIHAVGWAYAATFIDLDNDGFLDLYATAGFVSAGKEEPDG